MVVCEVGKVIKHLRKQAGMTIEDLVDDKMNSSTLSRIENGKTIPQKSTLKSLFEKLGINPNSLATVFVNDKFAEIQKLTDSLDNHLARRNTTEAGRIITELEKHEEFQQKKNKLNYQYLLAAKAANAVNLNEEPEIILAMIDEALIAPRKKFDEDQIAAYFLTKPDFHLLTMLAMQYYKLQQHERAVKILYGLKKNVEDHCIDKIEKGRRYPNIIYNLTKYLCLMGQQHEEVIKLCDEGMKVCLETSYLLRLPAILFNKAYSLYELGNKAECEQLLHDIYSTCRLYGHHVEMELTKNYATERGIVLE